MRIDSPGWHHVSHYRYAAYGSNLHPLRLANRVPSARQLGTGFLPGYGLRFNKRSWKDGSGKCNVVAGGSGVHLAIFSIAESERSILDGFEGLGAGYEHFTIEAEGFGTCSSYIAAPDAVDDSLRPFDWYRDMVLLGCAFNRFPASYARTIERVAAVQDPDARRARGEWLTVSALR